MLTFGLEIIILEEFSFSIKQIRLENELFKLNINK